MLVLQKFIIALLIAIFIISCGKSNIKDEISGSGTIEAEEVSVGAQSIGRLVSISVREGDYVEKGQVIGEIDREKLEIQLRQAEANLIISQTRITQAKLLSQLTSSQIQTQIQQAKALFDASSTRLAQAQIGVELQETATVTQIQQAEAILAQAEARISQAQDLYKLQKAQSESQVQQAEAALKMADTRFSIVQKGARDQETGVVENSVAMAKANFDDAKTNFDRMENLFSSGAVSQQQFDMAKLRLDVAQAQYQSARQQLSLVKEGARDEDKEAAKAQVDQANAILQLAKSALLQDQIREKDIEAANNAYKQAKAALTLANANALQNKLRKEDVIAAQAAVEQAQAALKFSESGALQSQIQEQNVKQSEALAQAAKDTVELLKSQIRDTTITAPIDGIVTNKAIEAGELVNLGTPIVTISNLNIVYLTIFVPQTKLGMIKLGQEASITVDSFTDRNFRGKVTYISPKAEFTPKNIQTKEERIKLVYGVKMEIENSDKSLKQGMPADAVLKF